MSREWKPGDVALVTRLGKSEVAIRQHSDGGSFDCWFTAYGSADYDDARPLAVIDPEDHEQVDDLRDLIDQHAGVMVGGIDFQTALREFANPAPQIEEPAGLGAVVEDAEGSLWFRMTLENQTWAGEVWQEQYGGDMDRWSKWGDINAVRMLSEGVTP